MINLYQINHILIIIYKDNSERKLNNKITENKKI